MCGILMQARSRRVSTRSAAPLHVNDRRSNYANYPRCAETHWQAQGGIDILLLSIVSATWREAAVERARCVAIREFSHLAPLFTLERTPCPMKPTCPPNWNNSACSFPPPRLQRAYTNPFWCPPSGLYVRPSAVGRRGNLTVGRLGAELDVEAGAKAAQCVALNILASMRAELGSLDRIERVVKIFGLVNCTPEFTQQPAVVNGCSELFADVFGAEAGVGARSAVGVNSLPLGVPVEIEAIFEI